MYNNKSFSDKIILFLICFLILILIFVIYKSEIVNSGSMRLYYLVYYKIIISSLILLIFISLLKEVYKKIFLISFLSILFSFYCFETFVTFKIYLNEKERLSQRSKIFYDLYNKEFDDRSEINFYNSIKDTNEDLVLNLLPRLYLEKNKEIFPMGNISKKKTLFCNENGYFVNYLSDRYGFNNPDKEWDNLSVEYLLLGDSFVHGACVNRPDDIASNIRKLSNKTVINLGYRGNGSLMQLASYKEYSNKKINNVIWFFYENDIWDLKRELDNIFLIKYLDDNDFNQNLKTRQREIDFVLTNEHTRLTNIKKIDKSKFSNEMIAIKKLIKLDNTRRIIFSPKLQPEFKKILEIIKKQTIQNNSNLYFVYLPSYLTIRENSYDKYFKDINKILNELDISIIDIKKHLFDKLEKPLELFPFGLGGHYNEAGYKKVAKIIFELTK